MQGVIPCLRRSVLRCSARGMTGALVRAGYQKRGVENVFAKGFTPAPMRPGRVPSP